MARLANYLEREPITVIADGSGVYDVELTVPPGWDAFWSTIDASGHGIRVTEADGITPVEYRWSSFTKATKTGVLRLKDFDSGAVADVAALAWLHYAPTAAPTDGSVTTWISTPDPAYLELGQPPLSRVIPARPIPVRSAVPQDIVQLPIASIEAVYLDFSGALIQSSTPYNGGPEYEELLSVEGVALDPAGVSVASRIDADETRFVVLRRGRERRLAVRYVITPGDTANVWTLVPTVRTIDPAGLSRRMSPRVGVRAVSLLEPA